MEQNNNSEPSLGNTVPTENAQPQNQEVTENPAELQENQPLQTTQLIPSSPKKSKLSWLKPLLIVIAILTLSLAGYFAFAYYANQDGQSSTSPTETPKMKTPTEIPSTPTPTDVPSSPTPVTDNSELLKFILRGGECQSGSCAFIKIVHKDGTLEDVITGDVSNIESSQIQKLKDLINSTDYQEIRSQEFTEECPTSYDGQEEIFLFYSDSGTERISSCETVIDKSSELFSLVNDILFK